MAAFRNAVERWDADMLEMDVRLTADERVVVLHDQTVDRTTDGAGALRGMTWKEARGLDAGFRFRDPEGRPSHRGRGVRPPLFDEVLEALPRTRVVVEPKEAAAAEPLMRVIRDRDAHHRVLVGAIFERLRAGADSYPGPWGASREQAGRFWAMNRLGLAGRLYVPRADAFQLPERWGRRRVVTPGLIRAAHAANMPVYVWTVDDPDDMRRLLEWGADGIMTDRPDILAGVLGRVAARGGGGAAREGSREGEGAA